MRSLAFTILSLLALGPVLAFGQPATLPEQPIWPDLSRQVSQAPEQKIVETPKFDCGLVTNYSGHRIEDGCLQAAVNVLLDDDHGASRRKGYIKHNQTVLTDDKPVRRLFNFDASDGNRYIIAQSSETLFYGISDGTYAEIGNGFSSTENFDCTQTSAKLWCVNRTDGLFWWDGSSSGTVASAPKGSLIDTFRNRVVIADVDGSQSTIFLSGFLDGTDWTTGSQSTQPATINIDGLNDGNKITCLMGTQTDFLAIGKESRLFALYGFDNKDFTLREISREVGCLDDTSVKEKDNAIYWLSQRGIERWYGTGIDWRVSDKVFDQIKVIVASAGNDLQFIDTLASHFEAGNLVEAGPGAPTSSTIIDGSILASTFSAVDTSSTNFSAGTLSNVSVGDPAGTVTLSSDTLRDDWDDLDYTTGGAAWTRVFGSGDASGGYLSALETGGRDNSGFKTTDIAVSTGRWSFDYNAYATGGIGCFETIAATCLKFKILNDGGDFYYIVNDILSGTAFFKLGKSIGGVDTVLSQTASAPLFPDRVDTRIDIERGSTGNIHVYVDSVLISSATDLSITSSTAVQIELHSVGLNASNRVDNLFIYSYRPEGNIVSRVFDTGFSTPTGGAFSENHTDLIDSTEGEVFFDLRSSDDGATWNEWVGSSDTLKIGTTQQYIQYRARFNTLVSSKTPSLQDVTLELGTTAQFRSQAFAMGLMTSWSLMSCDITSYDGTVSIEVSTGSTANGAIGGTYSSMNNNAGITRSTAAFFAYRLTFDYNLFVSTGNPFVRSCTINYAEGTDRPEVSAGVFDHRYHLFYTTSTASGASNDSALVLDKLSRWTQWDNIPAMSAVEWNRKLMIGDGSSGQIYELYQGDDDNGSDFTTRIRTKDWDLGNWRTFKQLDGIWLELDPEEEATHDIDITIKGHIDRTLEVNLNTVNLDEDTGIIAAEVPWPLDLGPRGRYIGIELSETGSEPWKFYRGALRYRPIREE